MTVPDTHVAPVDAEVADRAGLELVARRTLVVSPIDMLFPLQPRDRPPSKEGAAVGAAPGAPGGRGERGTGGGGRPGEGEPLADGELLFRSGGRWRIASGE